MTAAGDGPADDDSTGGALAEDGRADDRSPASRHKPATWTARDVAAGVATLADAQLGVVTRAQCLALNMTPDGIRWKLGSKRWRRVYHGVYATHTGELEWAARVGAAVQCCGDLAAASHRTAARLHGLEDAEPDRIEIVVPATRRIARPSGVQVRSCSALLTRTGGAGWPTRTTVEDTVLDLCDGTDAEAAIALVARACQRRRTTVQRLSAALRRRARHRWRELLTDAFADVADGAESVLEFRYIRRVERPHGLPPARRQRISRPDGRRRRTDNEYEPYRVVVELDGRVGHVGDGALRDRLRDNVSTVRGWFSLRFGWTDVDAQACETAMDVARVLALRGWSGRLTRCGRLCRVP